MTPRYVARASGPEGETKGETPLQRITFLLLVLIPLTAACQTVQPWERERLAHDCMQIPVDGVDSAFYTHVEVVREGSRGGAASGGGGCGCN